MHTHMNVHMYMYVYCTLNVHMYMYTCTCTYGQSHQCACVHIHVLDSCIHTYSHVYAHVCLGLTFGVPVTKSALGVSCVCGGGLICAGGGRVQKPFCETQSWM